LLVGLIECGVGEGCLWIGAILALPRSGTRLVPAPASAVPPVTPILYDPRKIACLRDALLGGAAAAVIAALVQSVRRRPLANALFGSFIIAGNISWLRCRWERHERQVRIEAVKEAAHAKHDKRTTGTGGGGGGRDD